MASLADYFDDSDGYQSRSSTESNDREAQQWSNVLPAQMPDFSIVSNAIDGMLLDQAKTEIQAVCKNVRQ
jgi:hypothetical protein